MIVVITVEIGYNYHETISDQSDMINRMHEKATYFSELPIVAGVAGKNYEQIGMARNIYIDKNGMLIATLTIREQFKDECFRICHTIFGVELASGCTSFVMVLKSKKKSI